MLNKVLLIGRLTKEPELKKSSSGKSFTQFSLAVNRSFKNDKGEYEADFPNCVAWSQTADFITNYLHKGSLLSVDGRLTTRSYDDPNIPNKKVYVTEVIVEHVDSLESKKEEVQETTTNQFTFDDDDIPF